MPTKVVFGRGVVKRVGDEVSKLGVKRVLIVTSKGGSMKRYGYLDRVIESLSSKGIDVEVFSGVTTNPTTDIADEAAEVCRATKCECVIGLGGGSSIDVAKAVAVIMAMGGKAADYILGGDKKAEKAIPIVAIPTTHGTGTEVDRYAVLTNPKTKAKVPIVSNAIFPKVSLLDPELTVTLPAKLSAATTIDAFTHALESYIGLGSTAIVDIFAEEALREIITFAPKLLNNLSDVEIREHLLYASMCAGIAISHGRTCALHALEHAVSAYHPEVHHGIGLAALLMSWIRYEARVAPERLAKVARVLGVDVKSVGIERAANKVIEVCENLLEKLDMKIRLRDLGVSEGELKTLAENAYNTMRHLIDNTPGKPSIDDLVEMLRDSL